MCTEFHFGKMKEFWRWVVVMVTQNKDVNERYT